MHTSCRFFGVVFLYITIIITSINFNIQKDDIFLILSQILSFDSESESFE